MADAHTTHDDGAQTGAGNVVRTESRSHSTTGTTAGGWSTQRIAICALFVAISLVVSYLIDLPVFPSVPYLKYDPSGAVCLVSGLAFGPAVGAVVSVVSWISKLLTDPAGGLMGIACALAITVPAALVYRRRHTNAGALVGMVVGGVVMIVVAIVGNVLITPLYTGMTTDQVLAMVVPVLLPFNLLKIVLNCVIAQIAYRPVENLAQK